MLNNFDFSSQESLNDAFNLIKSIFDKERNSYEKSIMSLKNKIIELEQALIKANKEKMKYQTKISSLKRKLNSISKTVSKLEESDYDTKKGNKELEKTEIIINMENFKNNTNNNIKYRNNGKANSFRKRTKYTCNINRSASDNFNQIVKNNFIDINNKKQFNNGEDIKINYNSREHDLQKNDKKALSSRIKSGLLNVQQTEDKIKSKQNNLFKSYNRYGDNYSLYLHSNGFDERNNRKIRENFGKKHNEKKVKYLSSEKFNKIEQKIKGIKSGLNIYKAKEESKLNENSFNNSYNFKENENEFTWSRYNLL